VLGWHAWARLERRAAGKLGQSMGGKIKAEVVLVKRIFDVDILFLS
jgi:hypothetical protein